MTGATFPARPQASLPHLSADQMREVDRAMVERLGVGLVQMMENAGGRLAQLARERFLAGNASGKRVLVLSGAGGNGGGGLVCARHLHNAGALVRVALARPAAAFEGVPALQLGILSRMEVPTAHGGPPSFQPDLVVDALVGYSLAGPPRGATAELIRWANRQRAPRLALDLPSGLDATTGAVSDPTVRAAATLTLALPKRGLRAPRATPLIGELYLADIGVPPGLYARTLGLETGPLFAEGPMLALQR